MASVAVKGFEIGVGLRTEGGPEGGAVRGLIQISIPTRSDTVIGSKHVTGWCYLSRPSSSVLALNGEAREQCFSRVSSWNRESMSLSTVVRICPVIYGLLEGKLPNDEGERNQR